MSDSSKRRAATRAARTRQHATGEPYAQARRHTTPDPDPARRTATATAVLDGHRWRISTSDGSYPPGRGGTFSWRLGRPYTDRTCFLEQVGGELDAYGWDITGPTLPDPLPPTVELVLVRNDRGWNLDEAQRLHIAAGVHFHTAHNAYIDACAAAVRAAGVTIHDLTADGGEPREGWFGLGPDLDDPDEPVDMVVWRDDRGWYHVAHPHRRGGLGNGPYDLPDLYGLTPPPHEVAAAVVAAFGADTPTPIRPWPTPAGYDPEPAPAEDDGWSVSAALERSLVAYTRPAPGV